MIPRNPLWMVLGLLAAALAMAGPSSARAADAPDDPAGWVTINFPENLELKALIDYVGQRRGINFLYDEQVAGKRVTLKAPLKVPTDSLVALLGSVLKMKGLVMAPTDVPGMMRIEGAGKLTAIAVGPEAAPDARAALAVTNVFELRHTSPGRVEQVIKPFLSATAADLTKVEEHGLIIVTDYEANMKRLENLVATVDRPGRKAEIRFIPVTHLEAEAMAEKVKEMIEAKARASGSVTDKAMPAVTILAYGRTNRVAVVGPADAVTEAAAMVESIDVPLGLETRIYRFTVASSAQVDRLARELIGDVASKRLYRSAIDPEANLLIVTASPEIHAQVEDLRASLDQPLEESQSPIRFYKLENAKAVDVLTTLRSIEGEAGLAGTTVDGVSAEPREAGYPLPTRPAAEAPAPRRPADRNQVGSAASGIVEGALGLQNTRVMADEATNTIIVVAKPSLHPVYERLIRRLDVRRPQVLIEATVVTLDTTDGYSVGVEISNSENVGDDDGRLLTFSSFGLSDVDAETGMLTLRPGLGFNGALVSADIANVVIRALESDSRAKVVARPSVLINDNAEGTLASEGEEPYASVNASTTVATTSLGGFVSAGTNIRVTPQISEGDHLKLEYEIELSSFGEDVSDTLPPSRQTNKLTSEATIPDGHTIVVGGLTREDVLESVDRLPILGKIPILEYLFSSRSKQVRETTLFVFIRAVILRADKFEDLKVVSDTAAGRAGLPSDWPDSEPVEIP